MLRILPLLLCAACVLAQEDSVRKQLEAADRAFRSRDYESARALYEETAAAAAEVGDVGCEVEALAQVARMCSLLDADLSNGWPWLLRAAERARRDEPQGFTRYLGVRGIFERENGQPEVALATFTELYGYALEHELPLRAIDAAHHAAIVGPPESQIAWAEKGIAAAEAAGSDAWLAVLWNNLGATYDWEREDYPEAIRCYEQARKFHHRSGGPLQRLTADWALGRARLLDGQLDAAEELLPGCVTQAEAMHEAAPSGTTLEWLGNTRQWLGELKVRRGDREAGLALMRQAREHLVEAGIEGWWPEGLAALDARLAELAE